MKLRRSALWSCLGALGAAAGWAACSLNPRTLDDPARVINTDVEEPTEPSAPLVPGEDVDGFVDEDDSPGEDGANALPDSTFDPDAGAGAYDAAVSPADAGDSAPPATITPR